MTFLKKSVLRQYRQAGGGNKLEDRTAATKYKICSFCRVSKIQLKTKLNEIKTKVILISLVTLLASQLRFRISRFLDYQRSKETFATHTVEGHDEAQSVCDEM